MRRIAASPVLRNFAGMKYFPINSNLHFQAKFIPDEKKIPIITVYGQSSLEKALGLSNLTIKGMPIVCGRFLKGKTLFFLFKDATNKHGDLSGRPDAEYAASVDGKVDLRL